LSAVSVIFACGRFFCSVWSDRFRAWNSNERNNREINSMLFWLDQESR
jgi:hypothetical protein